jgi:hypothetical protein
MLNPSSITIKEFDEQYINIVLKMMTTLPDFFSSETIDFAQDKLPELQGFLAFEKKIFL